MKRHLLLLSILTLLPLLGTTAFAQEHSHSHKPLSAPQGGRMIEVASHHAEFVVGKDRMVTVFFYDHDMKPVEAAAQSITGIAEAPAGKTKLEFKKSGNAFVSTAALPPGDGYNVVLQIKTADSKVKNFRILLNLKLCPECKLAEYACACEGHSGEAAGHQH